MLERGFLPSLELRARPKTKSTPLPSHQLISPIATETGIGPQNDPHRRPSHADLGNDPLNFF
jgi:hypothetical protein